MSGRSYYGSIGITNEAPGTPPPAGDEDGGDPAVSLLGRTSTSTQTDPPRHAQLAAAAVRLASGTWCLASGAWSSLTFGWVGPLLAAGNEAGRLDVPDLAGHPLPADCTTDAAYGRFLEEWTEELGRERGEDAGGPAPDPTGGADDRSDGGTERRRPPSLIHALSRAFGPDFLRAGLLKLVHDANLFVGPVVLNRLINFLRNPGAELGDGLALTLVGEFFSRSVCRGEARKDPRLILFLSVRLLTMRRPRGAQSCAARSS